MLQCVIRVLGSIVCFAMGHSCFREHCVFYSASFVFQGASCDWWNHMHNQHHSKPNVVRQLLPQFLSRYTSG